MKVFISFFKNLLGIIIFLVIIFLVSQLLDYLSPKLITLGWAAYIGIGIFQGIVIGILQMFLLSIFFPLLYLITSKSAKLICAIIGILGFIYSVITPWQYANVIGFRFIVIIWCVTLTIFIGTLFFSFLLAVLSSPEKLK
jgi:hypothetical protein